MRKIIASLDVGDFLFKLVVGEVYHNRVNVLACVDTVARGVKKGFVVNLESASLALQDLFDKAEKVVGIRPTKVLVSIPGNNAEFTLNEGYTSINGEDGLVTSNDIVRAMQSCVYNKVSDNRELVSILPTKFLLNDTDIVDNPFNMKAAKLKVKAVCITVPKKNIYGISKCLENIGVKIIDFALGNLGDYEEFRDIVGCSTVGAVVNIGAAITNVAIINKGIMTNCETVEIGGDLIDYDIARTYKLSRKDAIYVKEKLALADINMANASEYVNLINKDGEQIKINQYDVSEIVIKRLKEILNLIKKQINLLTKKEISYIIITGGVAETLELKTLVNSILNKAIIGNVKEMGARNNKYASALGIIKYYDRRLRLRNKDFSIYSIEEQEELGGMKKKINISEDSILGKLFGYFFDN